MRIIQFQPSPTKLHWLLEHCVNLSAFWSLCELYSKIWEDNSLWILYQSWSQARGKPEKKKKRGKKRATKHILLPQSPCLHFQNMPFLNKSTSALQLSSAWFKAKATKCQGQLILVEVKLNSFKLLIFSMLVFQFPAQPRSILHPLFPSPNLYSCLSLPFYLKNTNRKPTLTSAPALNSSPSATPHFLDNYEAQDGSMQYVSVHL